MFILKKGHQPGVYVPLRALFLVVIKLKVSGLHRDLCCGCSLESPRQGDSNGRPQHGFL